MRIQYYHKKDNSSVVTGLCGANCYHEYYPVVPGISKPTYTPEEIEEFNHKENEPVEYNGKKYTKYEATQRQRKLETTMRAQRQEIKLLKEGGANEDDLIAARSRYRGTSAEYARFSKAMDLPQQRERVTVDGLGNIGQGKYKADTPSEAKQEAPQQTQDTQKGISPVEQNNAVQSSTEAVTAPDNINNNSVDIQVEGDIIEVKKEPIEEKVEQIPENAETEYRQLTLDEFKSMKGDITKEERKIIYGHDIKKAYINSSEAKFINADLRNGVELTDKRKEIADTLTNVINKNTIPDDIQVYRYVGEDAFYSMTGISVPVPKWNEPAGYWSELAELPTMIKQGTEYNEKGFLSTSAVEGKNVFDSRKVCLKISVPKGTHGYISTNNKESEIIFGTNTKLRIDGCEVTDIGTAKHKIILHCTIVG